MIFLMCRFGSNCPWKNLEWYVCVNGNEQEFWLHFPNEPGNIQVACKCTSVSHMLTQWPGSHLCELESVVGRKELHNHLSNIQEKVNNSLYLQWKSNVSVGVMVQDHIIGHVKAFSNSKMVEERRLSGDIIHVHHSNIWDEQGEERVSRREVFCLLNPLPDEHQWGATVTCISTMNL